MNRIFAYVIAGIMSFIAANSAYAFPGKNAELCVFLEELGMGSKEALPENVARYLGVYDGKWDGKLSLSLIVIRASPDGTARGFYANGAYKPWKIFRPSCTAWAGKIDGDILEFTLSSAVVTFKFSGDNTLAGKFTRRNNTTPGTFERIVP